MNVLANLGKIFDTSPGDHSARRTQRVRLAVFSSGVAKLTAVLLQGVAIPLVYHSLGTHRYALYLLITAALATVTLMQFGIGPGLSQAIAKEHAIENHRAEAGSFAAAFLFVTLTSVAAGLVAYFLLKFVPSGTLFGSNYIADQAELLQTGHVAIAVLVATIVLSVADAALAGYQEQFDTNLGMSAANLCATAVLALFCIQFKPSISVILLVIYGTPATARLINLLILFRRRPYLLFGLRWIRRQQLRSMARIGGAFWIIQVMSVIEQQGGLFLMARLASVQQVAVFGIVFRAINMASSVVAMFTQSLWPALTDAVVRGDLSWIFRSIRAIRKYLMTFAFVIAILMGTIGQKAIEWIWHIPLAGQYPLVLTLGIYVLANMWTHLHYVILMGLDRVSTMSLVSLGENAMMIGLGTLLVPRFAALGMASGYLLASLALPCWLLMLMLRSRLSSLTAPAHT